MAVQINTSDAPLIFPTEIWLSIFEYTTPRSFIAFTQSCQTIRRMTMPDRYHFLQRLLELELDPLEGGGIPTISGRGLPIPTLLDDAGWTGIRYACAGCLKLRSHRAFDNHGVLSLRQRKPLLDAPAAQLLAEPGNIRARMKRVHARDGAGRQGRVRREKSARELMGTGRWPGTWPEEYAIKRLWELQGIERHRRLCMDCQIVRARTRNQVPLMMSDTPPNEAIPQQREEHQKTNKLLQAPEKFHNQSPVMRSRWDSDWAPNDMTIAKDMVKSLGYKVLKCRVCGYWQPMLSFVQPGHDTKTYARSFRDRSKFQPHIFATLVCFDCRSKQRDEMGKEAPRHRRFVSLNHLGARLEP